MDEGSTCPVIPWAESPEEAIQLLRESVPGVTNPAGELVRIVDDWRAELEHDPQRTQLVPVVLAALEQPHEIWRFVARDPDGGSVEHQPHLIWCRADSQASPDLFLAGTRRIGGELHLHTWFRLDDTWTAFRRYWSLGTLEYPLRRLRPLYAAARDVLYLHPEPHVAYRATRIAQEVSLFGYLDAEVGFPSLLGFELQDARRQAHLLGDRREIAGILASRWHIGDEVSTLSSHLNTLNAR